MPDMCVGKVCMLAVICHCSTGKRKRDTKMELELPAYVYTWAVPAYVMKDRLNVKCLVMCEVTECIKKSSVVHGDSEVFYRLGAGRQ